VFLPFKIFLILGISTVLFKCSRLSGTGHPHESSMYPEEVRMREWVAQWVWGG